MLAYSPAQAPVAARRGRDLRRRRGASKETMLLAVPALVVALWQNVDRRTQEVLLRRLHRRVHPAHRPVPAVRGPQGRAVVHRRQGVADRRHHVPALAARFGIDLRPRQRRLLGPAQLAVLRPGPDRRGHGRDRARARLPASAPGRDRRRGPGADRHAAERLPARHVHHPDAAVLRARHRRPGRPAGGLRPHLPGPPGVLAAGHPAGGGGRAGRDRAAFYVVPKWYSATRTPTPRT